VAEQCEENFATLPAISQVRMEFFVKIYHPLLLLPLFLIHLLSEIM
jgi:hypothetical protein